MPTMSKPLVTVIIPTYRRPEFFRQALESVLSQTYTNLDIFVVDHSPDTATKEIIAPYLKEDKRITYEHHPEFDATANWNRAFAYENPAAKYVNWLMDDDLFSPRKIEIMLGYYLSNPRVSLITSFRRYIDIAGNTIPHNGPILKETGIIPGDEAGRLLLTTMNNFIGEYTTVLMKKEYLQGKHLGWSGKEGEFCINDFPLWLRLLTLGDLLYIAEPLSYFRQHAGQDGKNFNIFMAGVICFGLEIEYARQTGYFLARDDHYRQAVRNWLDKAEYNQQKITAAKLSYNGENELKRLINKFRAEREV